MTNRAKGMIIVMALVGSVTAFQVHQVVFGWWPDIIPAIEFVKGWTQGLFMGAAIVLFLVERKRTNDFR